VALTPLLPDALEHAARALGDRLIVAMPGVVAYEPEAIAGERRVRYWTPKSQPTLLESRAEGDPRAATVRALQRALTSAGVPAELSSDVRIKNPATTIAMFPMLLAIGAGGSVDGLLHDAALLKLALAATKESRALAKTVGDLAGFASILLSFAGALTIKAGVKIARAKAPEALTFLERHYGGKLRDQNRAMFASIARLADARGVRIDALDELAGRAQAHAARAP
jgi:hypothetical protein